jgi:acyl carrier protein
MDRAEIFTVLKKNMTEIIGGARGREIQETHRLLQDFDADSLEVVEVISRTMKQVKIKVSRVRLNEANNIADLLDMFVAAQEAGATPAAR